MRQQSIADTVLSWLCWNKITATQGKYTWGVTGAVFEGTYCENKKVGSGKIMYPNKSFYEGR
jgi:hypothetical protein